MNLMDYGLTAGRPKTNIIHAGPITLLEFLPHHQSERQYCNTCMKTGVLLVCEGQELDINP